jgi:hypothetical protein
LINCIEEAARRLRSLRRSRNVPPPRSNSCRQRSRHQLCPEDNAKALLQSMQASFHLQKEWITASTQMETLPAQDA